MTSVSIYKNRISEIISQSDLSSLSSRKVRQQIESEFNVDLTSVKQEFDDLLMSIVDSLEERQEDHEEEQQEDSLDVEEDDDDSNDGIVDVTPAKRKRKAASSGKEADTKRQKKSTSNTGWNAPRILSPQLSEFLGEKSMSRPQVVKQMWVYIKENNLQDPSNKKFILSDEKLSSLFKKKRFDGFQMSKLLTDHIFEKDETASDSQTNTQTTYASTSSSPRTPKKKKSLSQSSKASSSKSGIQAPMVLSESMASLLGEPALSRTQVVKKLWEYIKENKLQDPSDGRVILCDEKLKSVLGVDNMTAFSMNKYISVHLLRKQEEEPQVKIEPTEPEVLMEPIEPHVNTDLAEPEIKTEPIEPQVNTELAESAAKIQPQEARIKTEPTEAQVKTEHTDLEISEPTLFDLL